MIEPYEIEYWQQQFPEISKQDIIDILEYTDDMKDITYEDEINNKKG